MLCHIVWVASRVTPVNVLVTPASFFVNCYSMLPTIFIHHFNNYVIFDIMAIYFNVIWLIFVLFDIPLQT